MLKKRLRGDAALIGGVVGPFTLVSQLAGTAAVLMTALRNPTALRPYLDFASKVGNEYARRQFDAGADAVCIEDMGASLDLTSPSIYRNLILPAQREMITGIGAPVILHICGSNTKILDLLSSTGAAALGLEAKTDLALAVRATECSIIGGVAPIEVLLSGEPPDVYRASIDCLVAGVHAVAPGCGLAARTPMENLREMTRAAREWET